ncbi:hypothetical protein [Demequina sp. NBRC 110053]|uniref:hypothetical protein n=1 Tax=Demequina sp. NBRC 110053 TaxID=1570342 RepID=UPI001185FBB2|nr:hypothetical protein [Demequina sp. NBRC 110053]
MTSSRWNAPVLATPVLAAPVLAALMLAGCSGDEGAQPDATPTPSDVVAWSQATEPPTSSTSEPSVDVGSDGDSTADAQDAEGIAALGTAVATIRVPLPDDWQYEGTYGDGTLPYAVLVDASRPFDLSEPGSDAYRDSVWVQVETYAVGGDSPVGEVPREAQELADLLAESYGAEAEVIAGDVPTVHVAPDDEQGGVIHELYARHGDIWILARPHNVDVDAYLDGEDVPILHAVLEDSEIA